MFSNFCHVLKTLTLAFLLPARAKTLWDVTFDLTKSGLTESSLGFMSQSGTDGSGTFYITCAISKGNGTSSPSVSSGSYVKWFPGNTITVTAQDGRNISQIEIVTNTSATYQPKNVGCSVGSIVQTGATAKWDGNASNVVLTNTATSNHVRIKSIRVYYDHDFTTGPTGEVYWTDWTYTDGACTKITAKYYTLGDINGDIVGIYPYDSSTYTTPVNATYTSSNTAVATVDGSGNVTALTPGTTTLTITASDGRIGTCALTVNGTPTVAAPTYSPVSGTAMEVGQTVTASTATDGAVLSGFISNEGKTVDLTIDNNASPYTYTFTEPGTYTFSFWASKNGYNDSETTEATYVVTKASAPKPVITFSHEDGEYAYGTEMSFTVTNATADNIIYTITDGTNDVDIEVTQNGTTYTFLLTADIQLDVLAINEDGVEAEGTRTYLVAAPAAPVFTPNADGTVTVTAKNSTEIKVAEYYIDGELGEYAAYTAPLTIDKMHRRFVAYSTTPLAQSAETEYFAPLSTVKKAAGNVYYVKVTDVNMLNAGDNVIVVNESAGKAMSNTPSDNNIKGNGVTITDSKIETLTNIMVLQLESSGAENFPWQFKTTNSTGTIGYLYAGSSSSSNYMKIQADANEYSYAKISIENGNAVIVFNRTNTSNNKGDRNTLRYNSDQNTGNIFSCYLSTSQAPVQLYKEVAAGPVEADYAMTFHHTAYNGPRNVAGRSPMLRESAFETHNAMTGITDESGTTYTYTVQPTDLCGSFEMDVEGTEMLTGHVQHNKTDFSENHGKDGVECKDENHTPYVYVANNATDIRLVRTASTNASSLSTNPDDHHGDLILHSQPTVTVSLDPFRNISMSLVSADGTTTGIEDIAADNATADSRLYNLNGVEIPAGITPAPGMYIRRQGNTAEKVIIR